jgi:hypothetical protein
MSVEQMRYILDVQIANFDLILSQPVSETYKGTDVFSTKVLRETAIKHGKKHYIISNCYFTGYDPMPFQTTDKTGAIISSNGVSYYPSICLIDLIDGEINKACISWCKPTSYSRKELDYNLSYTLTELKMRESKIFNNDYGIDIGISDYIEANFKNLFLFHTYNHPTNLLIIELVKRLFNKLSLPYDNVVLDKELLGDYSIPPPPSVYIGYQMTFPYPNFVVGQNSYNNTLSAMKIYGELIKQAPNELYDQWKSTITYARSKLNQSN